MSENKIKGIMDTTMDKLRAMVDADTIIGTPVVLGDTTLLPVSKVAFGLATGGSDFPSKNQTVLILEESLRHGIGSRIREKWCEFWAV